MNIFRRAWIGITDHDGKLLIAMAQTSEARLKRSRAMLVREQDSRRAADIRAKEAESQLDFLRTRVDHLEGLVEFARREQRILVKAHDALNAVVESSIAVHAAKKKHADELVASMADYTQGGLQ